MGKDLDLDWLPKLTVENILLTTDGKVQLANDTAITAGPPLPPDPIPLGSSGFVLTGHSISYEPKTHTGTLKTQMVPEGPWVENKKPSESPTRFELSISLDLPLTEVKVKGTYYLGDDGVGSLDGTISKTSADLTLTVPAKGQESRPAARSSTAG